MFFVVALYFIAPIIAGIFITIFPALQGWSEARLQDWLKDSVSAQFFYVLMAEAITIASLLTFLKMYGRKLSDIGLKRPRWKDLGIGLAVYPLYFVMFLLAVIIITAFVPAVDVNQEQQLGFDNVTGALPLIMTFISLVVLPPIVEELLVRGLLFTSLRKYYKLITATLVTSLVFAVAHLPGGGSGGPLYIAAVDTFLLSLMLCYVREKTGSLWAGITLHALKNAVAYTSLFIVPLITL